MENFDHRSILVDSGSIVHSCKLTKRSQVRGNARLLACRARSAALVLRARREDCLRLVRRQQRGWLIVEMFWQKKNICRQVYLQLNGEAAVLAQPCPTTATLPR